MAKRIYIMFILIAMLLYNFLPDFLPAKQDFEDVLQDVVTHVYDGDTIKIGNERIRLIGIDTPELNSRKKSKKPECFAHEAKTYLSKKILHQKVLIKTDKANSKRDKYGRLLGYVYLNDDLINAELIEKGIASAYTVFPFDKKQEFENLQSMAQFANLGIWQACDVKCTGKACKSRFKSP